MNLLPRLFDATGGTVLVDGVDVRDLDADLLWSGSASCRRRPFLFAGTVASNLRYGKPDATDEELWRALEIAQAKDFVEEMPGSSRPRSRRAARRSRAASASVSRSHGRS